ncbi:hypothetical protein K0M31_018654 [Melipona bicolor]|uniref:Uncharacterized protein n=1 Tax=Melipona bicolor TaxID=60889 RepID=A0AA40G3T2_9HYME|nr:hypothetical protein K0M31_018654 [Melipona bicolor]
MLKYILLQISIRKKPSHSEIKELIKLPLSERFVSKIFPFYPIEMGPLWSMKYPDIMIITDRLHKIRLKMNGSVFFAKNKTTNTSDNERLFNNYGDIQIT